MIAKTDILQILARSLLQLQQEDFYGFDPFDGLNSKLFANLPLIRHNALCRLAWLQLHKRSPINFRAVVGVPKTRNPKGIALIILGLLKLYKVQQLREYLTLAISLADWLIACADSSSATAIGWGYPFPWQARAFYVAKGTPNIIVTSYVAMAMHELWSLLKHEKYSQVEQKAANFLITNLFSKEHGYFFYIPGQSVLVHNANLWGAATVARACIASGPAVAPGTLKNQAWLNIAKQACSLSANAQRADGSWEYGELRHHKFIDGFHTGYNLEALKIYSDATHDPQFLVNINLGLGYYVENFFLANGLPKYYNNKPYPVDAHSASQAILTLLKCSNAAYGTLVANVVRYALVELYSNTSKNFYYQKHKLYVNKINYLRWTQAWMFYALAFYVAHG